MTTYETGKTYEINHERKGKMTVLVNHVDENGPWVQATIVAGRAVGVRGDVQAAKGDELTFRASLTKILREVPLSQ